MMYIAAISFLLGLGAGAIWCALDGTRYNARYHRDAYSELRARMYGEDTAKQRDLFEDDSND